MDVQVVLMCNVYEDIDSLQVIVIDVIMMSEDSSNFVGSLVNDKIYSIYVWLQLSAPSVSAFT